MSKQTHSNIIIYKHICIHTMVILININIINTNPIVAIIFIKNSIHERRAHSLSFA